MAETYLSSSLCRNKKLEDSIVICSELASKNVELSAPHPFRTMNELRNILRKFRDDGINFSLHNYFPAPKDSFVLNIASSEKDTQEKCNTLINQALELCSYSESKVYAVHAGYLSKAKANSDGMFEFDDEQYSYKDALNRAINFVNNISAKFEKNKVHFMLENLFPSQARNSSLFCNIDQIDELMNELPKEVGLLLDLGHLNISSNLMNFDRFKFLDRYLEKYGERVYEIHISENNGLKDEHRALEKDSWQLKALKNIRETNIKSNYMKDRVYCLESRNANIKDIKTSISEINNIIS